MTSQFSQLKNHATVQRAKFEFSEFISSLKSSCNKHLFEASSDFWAYHLGGISALVAVDLILSMLLRPSYTWGFHFASIVVWVMSFTFAALLFRKHYKVAQWDAQSQAIVLIKCIGCTIFFAVPIALLLLAVSTLFFDDLHRYYQTRIPGVSGIKMMLDFVFQNALVTAFHLLSWMILYIGITSRRKSKAIELVNLRLQNSLREAELSSLSNQLNPHFLFNALNNIRFMIHEDARNAETMLMSLSSVLRYSLDSSKQDKVQFAQELEISQKYIDLVQIQFEERLRFSIDIEAGMGEYLVPPMVLQMLLENAVKHGIENIPAGGAIQVTGSEQNRLLTLTVCNDLPADFDQNANEPGIGLLNIEQRLALLYGDDAELSAGMDGDRYCVTLLIPQPQLARPKRVEDPNESSSANDGDLRRNK